LDPETTQSILALLKQINRNLGVTIILITHELAVIHQVCDRVGVLDEGRLVEMGSVTDVFSQPHASATRRLITTSGLVAGVARNKSAVARPALAVGRWYKVSALLADKALQKLIMTATGQTLYMVGLSLAMALAVGVPLGVLLVVTAPGHILPRQQLNAILSSIVNTGRSIPFVILLFLLMPITKLLVGVSIGTRGAIFPLAVAAVPFVAG